MKKGVFMKYINIKSKKTGALIIISFVLILFLVIISFCIYENIKISENKTTEHEQIFGLTIDDSWYYDIELDDVIEGLKNLDIRPTVRIVMSDETPPEDYAELFASVAKYADIMACPVDSFEMGNFKDTEIYLARFKDSYKELSQYVTVWEVGNEINGTEWIKQEPELIIGKITGAAEFIKSKNGKIALTLYCTDSPRRDMTDWAEKYIPSELRETADYCFVSYYEDDNGDYLPEWEYIFKELGELFPAAYLGIGECGNTAENATQESKIDMARKYYLMPKCHERFVGGYFWWCWVEDCIPCEDNEIYEAFRSFAER